MFAITKCKFYVDCVVYGGGLEKHELIQEHRFSPSRVIIVERLIKIHRYPIYLHYRLLQMWSFKLSEVYIRRGNFSDFSFSFSF